MLRAEADAIVAVADRLDEQAVEEAVLLMGDAEFVHTVGVGKSAAVATKFAASLCSVGVRAAVMHPMDGLHGEVGRLRERDVVLLISASGNSDELVSLLPPVRARGCSVIVVSGEAASPLGRAADVFIDARVEAEACPLGVAPTTSSTVALALCDALLAGIMLHRSVSLEEFAANHPAGRIGRRLTLRVSDVMLAIPTVSPETPLIEGLSHLSTGGVGALAIVTDGRLEGLITDGDVRRTVLRGDLADRVRAPVSEVMTLKPVTVAADVLAVEAIAIMEERDSEISVLPVVDDEEKVVGIVRIHDLVKVGL